MDFNLKSDLQETCLTLIVNSTVCLGRPAVWPSYVQLSIRKLSVHMRHHCQVA